MILLTTLNFNVINWMNNWHKIMHRNKNYRHQYLQQFITLCPYTKRFHHLNTQFSKRIKRIHTDHSNISTNLHMHHDGIITQLTHIAQHQQFFAFTRHQHINDNFHRNQIDIVSIIDNNSTTDTNLTLQPTLDATESNQPLNHIEKQHTHNNHSYHCHQRIAYIITACHRQTQRSHAKRCFQLQIAILRLQRKQHTNIHKLLDTESQNALANCQRFPITDEMIIYIDDNNTIHKQTFENFTLNLHDAHNRSKPTQVLMLEWSVWMRFIRLEN
jgi:hypothetical protein